MKNLKAYWVGMGYVTCPDVAEMWGVHVGHSEWQFSNAPVGERSQSEDYVSLSKGLEAVCPAIIIFEKD